MTRPEFNNVFKNEPAQWAEVDDNSILSTLLLNSKHKDASKEIIQEARNKIEEQMIDIHPNERKRMDIFIKQQREIGTKERTIKRMVQRQWNITVI